MQVYHGVRNIPLSHRRVYGNCLSIILGHCLIKLSRYIQVTNFHRPEDQGMGVQKNTLNGSNQESLSYTKGAGNTRI
jgi:hypothetical protein